MNLNPQDTIEEIERSLLPVMNRLLLRQEEEARMRAFQLAALQHQDPPIVANPERYMRHVLGSRRRPVQRNDGEAGDVGDVGDFNHGFAFGMGMGMGVGLGLGLGEPHVMSVARHGGGDAELVIHPRVPGLIGFAQYRGAGDGNRDLLNLNDVMPLNQQRYIQFGHLGAGRAEGGGVGGGGPGEGAGEGVVAATGPRQGPGAALGLGPRLRIGIRLRGGAAAAAAAAAAAGVPIEEFGAGGEAGGAIAPREGPAARDEGLPAVHGLHRGAGVPRALRMPETGGRGVPEARVSGQAVRGLPAEGHPEGGVPTSISNILGTSTAPPLPQRRCGENGRVRAPARVRSRAEGERSFYGLGDERTRDEYGPAALNSIFGEEGIPVPRSRAEVGRFAFGRARSDLRPPPFGGSYADMGSRSLGGNYAAVETPFIEGSFGEVGTSSAMVRGPSLRRTLTEMGTPSRESASAEVGTPSVIARGSSSLGSTVEEAGLGGDVPVREVPEVGVVPPVPFLDPTSAVAAPPVAPPRVDVPPSGAASSGLATVVVNNGAGDRAVTLETETPIDGPPQAGQDNAVAVIENNAEVAEPRRRAERDRNVRNILRLCDFIQQQLATIAEQIDSYEQKLTLHWSSREPDGDAL